MVRVLRYPHSGVHAVPLVLPEANNRLIGLLDDNFLVCREI